MTFQTISNETSLLNERIALVRDYYARYQADELRNEPARLLCDYLSELAENEFDATLAAFLADENLGHAGRQGQLGGVKVDEDVDGYCIDYTTSYDATWLTLRALLDLAEAADATDVEAPLPDWFETSWMGMTQALAAQRVLALDEEDVLALLRQSPVVMREEDEVEDDMPSSGWGHANPREALLGLLEDMAPQERRAFLEG